MTLTIEKYDNSQVVRIPKMYLENLGLVESDSVNVSLENEAIVIRPALSRRTRRSGKTLEQRFEEFYGVDFETAVRENPYDFELVDWGSPVGDEIW